MKQSLTILTTGETAMHKLGDQIPDGTVLGARGPFGPYAPNNQYNKWFMAASYAKYKEQPNYALLPDGAGVPRREGRLGESAGRQRRQAPERGAGRRGAEGLDVRGPRRHRAHGASASGHQAIMETAYGTTKLDKGKLTVVNVKRYPAEQVNPPEGMKSRGLDQERLQGSACHDRGT